MAHVGQALSHYRLIEKIGAGGMGIVYRAHDAHLDREVAIKVLPPGTLEDESSRKRFRKEALALSRLNHPNIATIYDFDTQDGVDFLVMEYLPGLTLREKLAARTLPEREVLSLGTQLAEGLSAAHEHGVVHRDVKPGNLQLTVDGRLKILDFGLAKFHRPVSDTATTSSLIEMQTMAGTLPYMAPEQLLGEEIDARTDIHAAGSVLYEMATGQRPFAAAERTQLISAILHRPPTPPGALNPGLNPELERIISKCLEKGRENRYQSAKELAIDLKRLERSSEISSAEGEVSSWKGTRSKTSRRRSQALVIISILILVAVAAAMLRKYVYKKSAQPVVAPSVAVLPFTDLSPSHDQEYFSAGLAEEILNQLTKIPGLKVAARSSAFQFKGQGEDLRVIGKKLKVETVLEGSVRKDGIRVRINADLVKISDGSQLWSKSYERDLTEVFGLQDDIAKAVTAALRLKLLPGESLGPLPTSRTTPDAHLNFLQARYFSRLGDKESIQKALHYVNLALQCDPRYAAAYAKRASITLSSGGLGWTNYSEAIEKAREDTGKAIELDPSLPDGYCVLSQIQSAVDSNCRTAEITVNKALEIAPGDADNLGQAGHIAMCLGRQEEAVELLGQALALDPLRPGRHLLLAQNLRDLGRYAESDAALKVALDLSPNNVWLHETRGELFLAQGRVQEALEEMEKEPGGLLRDLGLALAYKTLGRERECKAALQNLISVCPNDCAYQIAQVYAYRGEADQAFEWLDRAHRQHDSGLMLVKTDLLLENLRPDRRYTLLLRRLNLPE